jgi:hypothetical protein
MASRSRVAWRLVEGCGDQPSTQKRLSYRPVTGLVERVEPLSGIRTSRARTHGKIRQNASTLSTPPSGTSRKGTPSDSKRGLSTPKGRSKTAIGVPEAERAPGKRRNMRPPPPVPVQPAFVSQLTCLALLGIDPRRYLDALVPRCHGSVALVGKLRLLPLEVAVAALRRAEPDDGEQDDNVARERQPETAAEVLAALGRRRVGPDYQSASNKHPGRSFCRDSQPSPHGSPRAAGGKGTR